MRRLMLAAAPALTLAAGPALAGDPPAPIPKPRDEALRAHADDYRAGTVAGRYRQTMGALGIVDALVEDAAGPGGEVAGDTLITAALQPDTSDLPAIRERGFLRLAVAPDPLMIAYDGERAIGVAMELARELEKHLRRKGDGTPTVVVPVPAPRTQVAARVQEGKSDFASLARADAEMAGLAPTRPLITDVQDVVVLGADVRGIETVDDLGGTTIYVQEDGRYARNLMRLNRTRIQEGQAPLDVRYVDARLDDYDLVEMVEIGVIPATVMSDFKAAFWSRVYTDVKVREDLALSKPDDLGWAVRTENPKLRSALDRFAEKVKKGTLIGNVVFGRYFDSTNWIENLGDPEARRRIDEVEPVIRRFAGEFGFEPDLVLAQAYQESQLDQSRRSPVGAVGVMQVMPATAADPAVGIPDISSLENNVHAGTKYLRWLRDNYYSDPAITPLDQTLLSFAAYNAGPGGVARARKRAARMGLDPNVWFENVEVAITRAVSREPAIYVRNIFKYYVSYRLLRELESEREAAREQVAAVSDAIGALPPRERLEALEEAEIVTGADPAAEQAGMATDSPGTADGPAERPSRRGPHPR